MEDVEKSIVDQKPLKRRSTRQRRIILDVVRSTKSHPSADWVYEEVKERIPNISLGTVYRNLKLLRDMGEVTELNFGSTFSRFDGNPKPHYHFTCVDCGQVLDVDIPVLSKLEHQVHDKHGWEVLSHHTLFYGHCDKCQQKQDRS